MRYIKPELTYQIFAMENIITASGGSEPANTSVNSLKTQLKSQGNDIMTDTTPTYVVMWN